MPKLNIERLEWTPHPHPCSVWVRIEIWRGCIGRGAWWPETTIQKISGLIRRGGMVLPQNKGCIWFYFWSQSPTTCAYDLGQSVPPEKAGKSRKRPDFQHIARPRTWILMWEETWLAHYACWRYKFPQNETLFSRKLTSIYTPMSNVQLFPTHQETTWSIIWFPK